MVLRLFQTVEACSLAIRVLATVRVDAHTALPPGLYFTNVRGRQRGFKLAHSRQGLPGAGKVDPFLLALAVFDPLPAEGRFSQQTEHKLVQNQQQDHDEDGETDI